MRAKSVILSLLAPRPRTSAFLIFVVLLVRYQHDLCALSRFCNQLSSSLRLYRNPRLLARKKFSNQLALGAGRAFGLPTGPLAREKREALLLGKGSAFGRRRLLMFS